MRPIARAAWAAALLNCALPQAWADDASSWLKDPYTQCRMFDANAKPGDHVGWLGECEDGLASGDGTAIFMNGDKEFERFTGRFANGVALDGAVTVTWGDGWRYEGRQAGGQFSGPGVLTNPARDRFDGTWTAGRMNGPGTLTRADGERYDGLWKDDLPDGEGTLTRADGSVIHGLFHDGKLDGASLQAPQAKPEARKKAPDVAAFAGISGKTLTSVDGSHIALTLIEGGIERQITDTGAQPKKTTFTFMNDRLGTVVEDGGAAAGANVTGFFRLTDTGVEVRYADGRGEMLTATSDGGVLMQRTGANGESNCRSWYPDGHVFSEADKKQALAEYASRLGLGPASHASCETASGSQAMLRPSDTRTRDHALRVKPVSLTAPARLSASAKVEVLAPVTVKDSVIHTIDADTAQPPVAMTRLAAPPPVLSESARDTSACLKVESDGRQWSFRNECGSNVQFSYCIWHGSEPLAACGGEDGVLHAISGSVAAKGAAALTADTSFSEKDGEHDFRWVACAGGAGEVVAHLDRADPPSGRCERAAVAVNRH